MPSGGELQSNLGGEDYMLVDSFTLADELTFEPSMGDSDSIRNCISTARENARQVRHVLGKEMWSNLNAAYMNFKIARIENFWNNQPRKWLDLGTGATVSTLSGIMENSMYRDHGWYFAQLGRFVERLQIVASLLDAQIEVYPTDSDYSDCASSQTANRCQSTGSMSESPAVRYCGRDFTADEMKWIRRMVLRRDPNWTRRAMSVALCEHLQWRKDWYSLLNICEARLAYSRLHSLTYQPDTIINFLVSDPHLSHSIRYALTYVVNLVRSANHEPLALLGFGAAAWKTAPRDHSVTEIGGRLNVQLLQQQVDSLVKQVDGDWPNRIDGDSAACSSLQKIHRVKYQ